METVLTSGDVWLLAAAGLVAGGVAAWTLQRRRRAHPRAADKSRNPLKTCEGIGPPRDRDRD